MKSTEHISQVTLPGINLQKSDGNDTAPPTDSDYLTKLKTLVDAEVETVPDKDMLKEAYKRDMICEKARRMLCEVGHPTLEELNFCFPDYDHTEWIESQKVAKSKREAEAEQAGKVERAAGNAANAPTRQQAEERLNTPPEPKDSEYGLTVADWKWLEKANHPLGGGLFYGGGVTPQFMELDLKLGISDSPHRRRLLDYLGLHCGLKTGITNEVTVGELSDKLQCGKDKIREGMKWLVKKGVLEYSDGYVYPKHYTTGVVFVLPFVRDTHETKGKANALRTKTGISYQELWERREEFGFVVNDGGEAEGEGVEPPSSS